MKLFISIVALCLTNTLAFTSLRSPAFLPRSDVELNAIFDKVSDLDFFAPNKKVNDYGQRGKKGLKMGKVTKKSYVPAGLTLQQYDAIRQKGQKRKDENYARNVSKAGKFQNFTKWYKARGTDKDDVWKGGPTNGHTMAKTKYDWGDFVTGSQSKVVMKPKAGQKKFWYEKDQLFKNLSK